MSPLLVETLTKFSIYSKEGKRKNKMPENRKKTCCFEIN